MDTPTRVLYIPETPDPLGDVALSRRSAGVDLVREPTPERALARLADEHIDVVVAGYALGETDGLDLLRAVRARHDDCPFVLVTEAGDESVAAAAVDAGATGYVRPSDEAEPVRAVFDRIRDALPTDLAPVRADGRGHAESGVEVALSEALASSSVGVVVVSNDGEVRWANDAVADFFGTDRGRLVGSDERTVIRDQLTPAVEQPDEFRDRVRVARDADDTERFECHVLPGDDRPERWLQYRSHPITTGGLAGGRVEQYHDVTDRERMRGELTRRLDALGELWEVCASDRPFREKVKRLLDVARGYLDTGTAALNTIQEGFYEPIVLVGDGSTELDETTTLEEVYCRETLTSDDLVVIEDAPNEGWAEDPAYTELNSACYIGGQISVDDEAFGTVCFTDGEPKDAGFSAFDRTYVRLLARWLSYELEEKRAREEYARENERLDQFASVVSHDLRSPLSVAVGYLEIAREDGNPEAFDHVEHALEQLDDIIDDALATARLGGQVREPEELSLGAVARSAWATTDVADTTLDVTDDVTIEGDETRLERLFENLFRNASEHGNADEIRVGLLDSGFYVADDGTGIPESNRAQVFRGGFSTERDGTGFGLALVREIAEAHGYDVTVTESDDGGARFEFRPRGIDID
ncbi:hypothetical protein BRD04_03140 [Halobacteriales archaeon QS_9_67_17]|nr:MAG: hypothetical protein BRD04_03140 [Halobacteriales archaeon QS_9_67_17]